MMVTGYIVIHVYIVIFFPCYLYVQDKVLLRFPPAVQTLIIIIQCTKVIFVDFICVQDKVLLRFPPAVQTLIIIILMSSL